jgi:hypothetical protein
MWDIIIGSVLLYPLIEMAEEWRLRRAANRLLTQMRKHAEQGRPWDVTRGQWSA